MGFSLIACGNWHHAIFCEATYSLICCSRQCIHLVAGRNFIVYKIPGSLFDGISNEKVAQILNSGRPITYEIANSIGTHHLTLMVWCISFQHGVCTCERLPLDGCLIFCNKHRKLSLQKYVHVQSYWMDINSSKNILNIFCIWWNIAQILWTGTIPS